MDLRDLAGLERIPAHGADPTSQRLETPRWRSMVNTGRERRARSGGVGLGLNNMPQTKHVPASGSMGSSALTIQEEMFQANITTRFRIDNEHDSGEGGVGRGYGRGGWRGWRVEGHDRTEPSRERNLRAAGIPRYLSLVTDIKEVWIP